MLGCTQMHRLFPLAGTVLGIVVTELLRGIPLCPPDEGVGPKPNLVHIKLQCMSTISVNCESNLLTDGQVTFRVRISCNPHGHFES